MREIKKNLIDARVKVTSLLFLLVSVFLLSALARVELFAAESAEGPYDWPMFSHDSQHTGYTESPGPITNQTLWTFTYLYGGGVTPAIVDGRVYFGAWDSKVYCLNHSTGAEIWNFTTGGFVFCTAAVTDGKVFVGSMDYNLYCLDAASGEEIWNFAGDDEGFRGAVTAVDGRVYACSEDKNIYCLNATTGAKIWNYTTGDVVYSFPAVVEGSVYVGSNDTNVYCLDAATGALNWNYTTGDYVCSGPAVVDSRVFVGSFDNNIYCLDANTGAKIWNYTTGDAVFSSPSVADGKVFVGSFDDNVYCLDMSTGALIWNYTTGDRVYGSPAVAGGKVYVGSSDWIVYCFDAETGAVIWNYKTIGVSYHGPAVANGVVYVLGGYRIYAFSDSPPLTGTAWSRTYGGTGEDMGTGETVQTSDGGYAISGDTNSSGAGGFDFWLFKTDAACNMEWNQTYGGTLNETIHDMCQTSDEGYLMSGTTESFGAGGTDAYLVKTDSAGNMEWNITYGGTSDENGRSVIQTSDGGYAMTGHTSSYGAGDFDGWLVKTDASGNMEWNMTYGGTGDEDLDNVIQTGDGGYLFAGQTNSFGAGNIDGWLVKTDASGNMEWNQTYGGTGIDITYTISMSGDGGYALTGFTTSLGGYKAYLVKTDEDGNMMWNQTYSTSAADIGIHGIPTSDGGYAIIGWNYVNGQDFVLYKTNATGDLEWNMTYGGTGLENGYALLQTDDGGYVLTGTTDSFGAGGSDVWLVKVDGSGLIPESFTITVVVLLSTAAVVFSFSLLPKRSKWKKYQR